MSIISSRADYNYCTLPALPGDVGSDIYPLRSDDKKHILRFCDFAFALEACLSRACIFVGIKINGSEITAYMREKYDAYHTFLSQSIKSSVALQPFSFADAYTASYLQAWSEETISEFAKYKETGGKSGVSEEVVTGNITVRLPNNYLINKRKKLYETNKPISPLKIYSDSGSYYPESIYAEISTFIQTFKSYPYFFIALSVPTYTYAFSGSGYPSSANKILFATFQPSDPERKSYEYYSYISGPLFTAEIVEPALHAVDIVYIAHIYVYSSLASSYKYLAVTLSSLDGKTCSEAWIAKAREMYPDYELAIGGTGNYISITLMHLYVAVKSKEDIDYLAETSS